jgi:hypothetical protein
MDRKEEIVIIIALWVIQFFIWAGYVTVEHFSRRDESTAKMILFFIFFYLAYVTAQYIVHRRKKAAVITIYSLFIFICIEQVIKWCYS